MSDELSGWTVVVTRPEASDGPLTTRLERLGARVLRVATVEIGPPADDTVLEAARASLDDYDWVAFTSARAVRALLPQPGVRTTARVAVVGPATRAAAEASGLEVTLEGSGSGAAALADALIAAGVGRDTRVLFPCSDQARPDLIAGLRAVGAQVDDVVAYETTPRRVEPGEAARLADADVVTFTSPTAVDGWAAARRHAGGPLLSERTHCVAIGMTTAARLADFDISAVHAEDATFDGIVERIRILRSEEGHHVGGSS